MSKTWLTVVVLALGAGGARAGEFASDQLLPPLSQPLPAPRAQQAPAPAPAAQPAVGQAGCAPQCASCDAGRGSRLKEWLCYRPLQRGACKHGCHGCCARTPPLYTYFLPPCTPCVEGKVPSPCGRCDACGRACATGHGALGFGR